MNETESTFAYVKVDIRTLTTLISILEEEQQQIERRCSFNSSVFRQLPIYNRVGNLLKAACAAYDEAKLKGGEQ